MKEIFRNSDEVKCPIKRYSLALPDKSELVSDLVKIENEVLEIQLTYKKNIVFFVIGEMQSGEKVE